MLGEPRALPKSGLVLSPLGLGTAALGNLPACERHGVPLPTAALQFAWGHPAVVSVLNGANGVSQFEANLSYAARPVPAACWEQLRSDGLLAPEIPLPALRTLTLGVSGGTRGWFRAPYSLCQPRS